MGGLRGHPGTRPRSPGLKVLPLERIGHALASRRSTYGPLAREFESKQSVRGLLDPGVCVHRGRGCAR